MIATDMTAGKTLESYLGTYGGGDLLGIKCTFQVASEQEFSSAA
jgi:hypothetical protein